MGAMTSRFQKEEEHRGSNGNRTESRTRELGKECCGNINSEPMSKLSQAAHLSEQLQHCGECSPVPLGWPKIT